MVGLRQLSVALAALGACLWAQAVSFELDWKAVDGACSQQKPRTAVALLSQIEAAAAREKSWPDWSVAIVQRAYLEEQFTGQNAPNRNRTNTGLAKIAACVDGAPAEVQPMLRLALLRSYQDLYVTNRLSTLMSRGDVTSTNCPLGSVEQIRPKLQRLFSQILQQDAPILRETRLAHWRRLFPAVDDDPLDAVDLTLFDFAILHLAKFLEKSGTAFFENDASRVSVGLSADVLAGFAACCAHHAADTNRTALASVELARLEFLRRTLSPVEYGAQLEHLAEEHFDSTWVSALAAIRLGDLREAETNVDFVALHDLYQRFGTRWSGTSVGDACNRRLEALERPELTMSVETNWSRPLPRMSISCRNLTNAYFRLVRLTRQDIEQDHSMGAAEDVDKIRLRTAVREWTVDLPHPGDCGWHSFSVPVPENVPRGFYKLLMSSDAQWGTNGCRTVAVYAMDITVTDLAVVLSSESTDDQTVGYVVDAETGKPIEGAAVSWKVSRNDQDNSPFVEKRTMSAKDGSFKMQGARPPDFRVVKGEDSVRVQVNSSLHAGSGDSPAPVGEMLTVITDRAVYRPGQRVQFKGYAYFCDAVKQDFHVLRQQRVRVDFMDPSQQVIARRELVSNAFGTFSGKFDIPQGMPTGAFQIVAHMNGGRAEEEVRSFCVLHVGEYRPPRFSVQMNPREKAILGRNMCVTGTVLASAGVPVVNAKVRWRVERKTSYPGWWPRQSPKESSAYVNGTATTDDTGAFAFSFVPQPPVDLGQEGNPSFTFKVHAVIIDATGETHEVVDSFVVATVPWWISLRTDESQGDWFTPASPVPLSVSATTMEGRPASGVRGTVAVYALRQPRVVIRKERTDDTCPEVAEAWEKGPRVGSYDLTTDGQGLARVILPRLPVGVYRAEYTAMTPEGRSVQASHSWHVVDPATGRHGINEPAYGMLARDLVDVGEKIRLYWGSGYTGTYCRVIARHGKRILKQVLRTESAFCFELPVTSDMVGEVVVETVFVRENRLYHKEFRVRVPRPDCDLEIVRNHLTSKLTTGEEETWSFTVSGPEKGDAQSEIEMLAFMYDHSLDSFVDHEPSLPFERYFSVLTPPHTYSLGNWTSACQIWGKGGDAADCSDAMGGVALDESEPPSVKGDGNGISRNLAETAFFLPHLTSDEDGQFSFSFRVPDALTGWKFVAFAHDGALRSGILKDSTIVTTKPFMVEPQAPQIVREGDRVVFPVKVTNLAKTPQTGTVKLSLFEEASKRPIPQGPEDQTFSLAAGESGTFEFPVGGREKSGRLRYVVTARGLEFSDSVEGVLPILSSVRAVR